MSFNMRGGTALDDSSTRKRPRRGAFTELGPADPASSHDSKRLKDHASAKGLVTETVSSGQGNTKHNEDEQATEEVTKVCSQPPSGRDMR